MKHIKLFEQFLAEAQSVDIQYALKDIKNYNNGKRTSEDLTHLAQSIIKNLGYKTTTQNTENVENHLIASETNGRIPEDKTLIKELYPLLESYDGDLSDLKYEFPLIFQQETQWSPSQIKQINKKGSSYTVKTTLNISKEEMEKVGMELGLKLISYTEKGSTVETVYK